MSAYINVIATVAALFTVALVVASTSEGFWGLPSRSWKVEKVLSYGNAPGDGYETAKCGGGDAPFVQTPHFQSLLSPRFANVDYGAYIRNRPPNTDMLGVPTNPLGYSSAEGGCVFKPTAKCDVMGRNSQMQLEAPMASDQPQHHTPMSSSTDKRPKYKTQVDAYAGEGSSVSYASMGAAETPTSMQYSMRGDGPVALNPRVGSTGGGCAYDGALDALASCSNGPVPTDTVMSGIALSDGPDGEINQPIVFDRYIYANRNSRLRRHGDPIRGDLPVVPKSGDWFRPSVNPNIDLQAGAINVMAGVDNETSRQLANLIYNASGRADTTIGGVDMAAQMVTQGAMARGACNTIMGNQYEMSTSMRGGDVQVQSFP